LNHTLSECHWSISIKDRQRSVGRLRNDLYCVEWGVKLYSLTHADTDTGTQKVCVVP